MIPQGSSLRLACAPERPTQILGQYPKPRIEYGIRQGVIQRVIYSTNLKSLGVVPGIPRCWSSPQDASASNEDSNRLHLFWKLKRTGSAPKIGSWGTSWPQQEAGRGHTVLQAARFTLTDEKDEGMWCVATLVVSDAISRPHVLPSDLDGKRTAPRMKRVNARCGYALVQPICIVCTSQGRNRGRWIIRNPHAARALGRRGRTRGRGRGCPEDHTHRTDIQRTTKLLSELGE